MGGGGAWEKGGGAKKAKNTKGAWPTCGRGLEPEGAWPQDKGAGPRSGGRGHNRALKAEGVGLHRKGAWLQCSGRGLREHGLNGGRGLKAEGAWLKDSGGRGLAAGGVA